MTAHKAAALHLIDGNEYTSSLADTNSTAQGLAALSHATLELADQQRAANIIAYFGQTGFNPQNPSHMEAHEFARRAMGVS